VTSAWGSRRDAETGITPDHQVIIPMVAALVADETTVQGSGVILEDGVAADTNRRHRRPTRFQRVPGAALVHHPIWCAEGDSNPQNSTV
jgi:hypothetical protein